MVCKFSKNPICLPDYDHCILGISNSILRYYGAQTHGKTLPVLDEKLQKKYKNVVFMIFDGMGVDLLKHHLMPYNFLRRKIKDNITSVFPPTTAAATISFYSALPPITHAWVAWCVFSKKYKKVIELFTNKNYYTQKPLKSKPITEDLPYEHIFEQIKKTNKNVTTTEIFPPFKPNGAKSVEEQCQKVIKQAEKKGKQFILTYWSDPDHLSHEYGPYAKQVKAKVKEINNAVKKMSEKLSDTLIIVSADHGHLPVQEDVCLNDYKGVVECLQVPISLDSRVAAIFLKPNKEMQFKKLFNKYFAKDFMLIKSETAIKQGLFGKGKINPKAVEFLGDFLMISTSYKSVKQRLKGKFEDDGFLGAHAGLTEKEMMVPLILIDKK